MANLASTSGSMCAFSTCFASPSRQHRASLHTSSRRRDACLRQWAAWPSMRRGMRLTGRCPRRRFSAVRASLEPEGELDPEVGEGTRIRVTGEVTVYHAPKIPELNLKGKEGSVKLIVKQFKGKELSANLPYRVEFELESDSDKPKKFFAHLDASEFEKVQ